MNTHHSIELRYAQHIMDKYRLNIRGVPKIPQEQLDIYLGMLSRYHRRIRSLQMNIEVYSAGNDNARDTIAGLEKEMEKARKFMGPTFNMLASALDLVGIVKSPVDLLRTGYWLNRNAYPR